MNLDLPIRASKAPSLSFYRRIRAILDMWFVDHGFIRDIYLNLHPVSQTVWRSAQPAPHHLKKIAKMGIKTILNLRGRRDSCGSYILEREACEKYGLTLIDFPIRSRAPLEKATLQAALKLFSTLEYPILIHCKSGADRAGFMSVFYLFTQLAIPLDIAMNKHLSLSYGHIKQAKTGIIDYFYQSYLNQNKNHSISFEDWIDKTYDPLLLEKEFKQHWIYGLFVDWILRRE